MSEVIVITSGKGGVGKTTTTANVGTGLAKEGKKVVLIDTDIGLRNLDVVMGLENRIVYNLVDVIEGNCRIKQALIKDKRYPTLYLLPSAQTRDKTAVTPEQMEKLTNELKEEFDYILLDCPAGIEQGFKNAIAGADRAIVVTTPEVSAVRDADRIIGLLEANEIGKTELVVNRELFEINGDEFKIASLDLVRVSIRKIHLKESYDPIKVVIPGKTLSEVSKVLNGGMDDEVSISFSKNHVLFEFDETVVVSRLIEGNFYNIDQMLKTNYETTVKINKNELYGCIDRATLLLREAEKKPVILHIKEDEIQMEMNTKIGSMDEEVTAEKEGKDLVIAFNPKYINDVLKVIDDEEVTLYLFNANAPCFIKNEEESYIYLILPVNMN